MSKAPTTQSGHFHAVRFYDSAESLCRIVAGFLAEGLHAHQPALVIATPDHRAGIAAALCDRDVDVDALQASGDLLLLDAEETLEMFMVDGMPDTKRFDATGTRVIERACRGRKDCTIRAYGEMVDVLWKNGQSVAAVRLEMLWNKLAATRDFSLLCGYAMGNFYKGSQQQEICAQHTHLVSEDGSLGQATATLH
jgi:hypothetical protein